MAESCPTCGGAVEVRSSREGTNHYVPVERGRVEEAGKLMNRLREPCADERDCCERCCRVEELGR